MIINSYYHLSALLLPSLPRLIKEFLLSKHHETLNLFKVRREQEIIPTQDNFTAALNMSNFLLKKNNPIISLFALWHWMKQSKSTAIISYKYKIHSLCISHSKQTSLTSFTILKKHYLPPTESVFLRQPSFVTNLLSNIRNTCTLPFFAFWMKRSSPIW